LKDDNSIVDFNPLAQQVKIESDIEEKQIQSKKPT